MKSVAEIRAEAMRRCERSLHAWVVDEVGLAGTASWPQSLSLGQPAEEEADADWSAVVTWAREWQQYRGPGSVELTNRRWRSQGMQSLPKRITFAGAIDMADFAGPQQGADLRSAVGRVRSLADGWPSLIGLSRRHLMQVVALDSADVDSLHAFLHWLDENPALDVFPRAMSIPGVDTKWFERHRSLCEGLWQCRVAAGEVTPFGLRRLPDQVQVKVLDPALRSIVGGMGEFAATIEALSALAWRPATVIVCENQQTGLSFGERPDTVVLHGRGYAIERLGDLGWLRSARAIYWGDLDTHGFAILSRLRGHLPHVESALMDERTLHDHAGQWVTEPAPTRASLANLTDSEAHVYRGLVEGRWGDAVRLEQERVVWSYAMDRLGG
jgi:hypothetical protein